MTTTTPKQLDISKSANDALIDQLRACHSSEEILRFEHWFNTTVNHGELYSFICELLRNRSISRGLAAKWLSTLLIDRDRKISLLKNS